MELRHLRYFVAVAEERHFTRAAERLGIAQPPLSQQIKQLEEELGGQLLRRLSRGVELTKAGEAFLEEAKAILAATEHARTTVERVARGLQGNLRVGFTGSASFNIFVPYALRLFKEKYPDVSLTLTESTTPRLNDAVAQGQLDVAFVRPPFQEDGTLGVAPLFEEDMLIALPIAHPLARNFRLPLEALAEETFILYPRSIGPGLYDRIIAACQAAGFSPKTGQEAPQLSSTVNLVAAGLGIAIVPASMTHVHADSVSYHPIVGDVLKAPLGLAFRRNAGVAAIRNFVTEVKAAAAAGLGERGG
jgi:DNA-binding transcriptional LysR family regulator